jgi:uncharacterized protein YjdB/Tol biopolymer transport system component
MPVLLLAMLAACSDDNGSPGEPGGAQVARVVIQAGPRALPAGDTVRLRADARTADGAVLPGRSVAWTSSDTAIARVASSGLVTAVRAGTVTVRGTIESKYDTAQIVVTTNPLPAPSSLAPGSVLAGIPGVTVTVHGEDFVPGTTALWSGEARPTTVVSSRELRVVLAAADVATPRVATIQVRNPAPGGGASAGLAFTVSNAPVTSIAITPPTATVRLGRTVALQATPRAANGEPLEGRVVRWLTSDPFRATVSDDGIVTGIFAGEVTITAISETVMATAAVTVLPANIAVPSITAIRPDSTPAHGGAQEIAVVGENFQPTAIVFWNSSSRPTTLVDDTTLLVTLYPGDVATNGTRSIRVYHPTANAWSAPATFLVRGITRVEVSGERDLWTGEQAGMQARGTDWENTQYPSQPATWASTRPDVATVDANGVVRALSPGTTTITATMAGRSGTRQVRVLDAPAFDLLFEGVSPDTNMPEIWVVTPGATNAHRRLLPAGTFARTPAVTRDGNMIAFAGVDQQIWVVGRDGTGLRRVTGGALPKDQPAWSPDGSLLLYREQNGATSHIGAVGEDGSGQRLLTALPGMILPDWFERPTWNRDGSRMLFAAGSVNLGMGTRLMWLAPGGTTLHALPNGPFSDTEPAYSPDGGTIAVVRTSTQPGGAPPQITLLDSDGAPYPGTIAVGSGRRPAWSPDGAWLAFLAPDQAGGFTRLVITRRNDPLHKLAMTSAANPVWIRRL